MSFPIPTATPNQALQRTASQPEAKVFGDSTAAGAAPGTHVSCLLPFPASEHALSEAVAELGGVRRLHAYPVNELRITPVPEGSSWPSGDYIDLAALPISEDELALRLGLPLLRGNEAGLGPWAAIGGKLPSGTAVEFIRYAFAPDSKVVLRVDKSSVYAVALDETLQIVGLSHNELPWITPLFTA